jgi:predicted XRE-type DNA-binding protein
MSTIKKHKQNITWEEGSTNVFKDLDMPNAEEKLAKVELALKINKIITQRGLKQVEAARLLGVDQAKISLLHRGQLSEFSIERLVKFLTLLHQDIDIVVKKSTQTGHFGKLRVIYV